MDQDSVDIELVATAFEGPPNKHSVYALSLYFTQKCVEEGLGKSTADGIHGAFANYWDHLPDSGRKYAGDYLFNAETGKVSGNPARALEIPSFLKCIKNIAWVKGAAANRHHAEATTIEDMRMSPQETGGRTEELGRVTVHASSRPNTSLLVLGLHFLDAEFETCQIQMRDITEGIGASPHKLPLLRVFLDNRKGWQLNQGYDGPSESLTYEIYEQKDMPEIDMFSHVHHLINKFSAAALIKKFFTMHCLRRGGSQYRFMFAPLGKRWSLTIIRWWGGWAEGEHAYDVENSPCALGRSTVLRPKVLFHQPSTNGARHLVWVAPSRHAPRLLSNTLRLLAEAVAAVWKNHGGFQHPALLIPPPRRILFRVRAVHDCMARVVEACAGSYINEPPFRCGYWLALRVAQVGFGAMQTWDKASPLHSDVVLELQNLGNTRRAL
ncbi:hypothetical protein B0H14DRAFT_3666279 [Mycena olivaceomarginata]|nr:hypothetical protein B0H14DRAFT_3666279 [Mycena olivaceomarginata]